MKTANKKPASTPDKNLNRIRQQTKKEEQVRRGAQPSSGSGEGSKVPNTSSDMEGKFQTGSPSHPMFAVDPELERQMAAQDVPQNSGQKKRSTKKSGKSATKERKGDGEKGPGQPKDRLSGPWEGKGEPTFASTDPHQPGIL